MACVKKEMNMESYENEKEVNRWLYSIAMQ